MTINELYNKAREGDAAAEKELFEKLTVRLRLIATQRIWSRIDSEDVSQDALMTITKEYRDLQVTVSFTAWACKVLDNKILNYIRAKGTQTKYFESSAPFADSSVAAEENPLLKDALLKCLKEISKHNPRYSRAVNLQYQGYSSEEICSRLGVTKNNAYVMLSRARSMLKECLKRAGVV